MISWMRLLFEKEYFGDRLRYARPNDSLKRPVVVWNITSSCNLNCHHCYSDAGNTTLSFKLTEREAKRIILDLSQFKIPVLLFSGGEPLLRSDIFRLGKFTMKCGVRPVLSTNGTLITPSVAKRIKAAEFEYVGISIDGREQTHDRMRRKKGAFVLAVKGIRNCQKAGVKTGLRFTLMKENFKDLGFIFDFVKKENIKRLCIYHLVYSGRAKRKQGDDLLPREKREVLELIWKKAHEFERSGIDMEILTVDNHADGVWLYQKVRATDSQRAEEIFKLLKRNGGSGSGRTIAAIDHLGNVFADQFWRTHAIGNVNKNKFSEIWLNENDRFLNELRNRKKFIKGRCQRCNYFCLCNGNMRVRAEAVFGDRWAQDPACYLSDKEIYADAKTYSSADCVGANTQM